MALTRQVYRFTGGLSDLCTVVCFYSLCVFPVAVTGYGMESHDEGHNSCDGGNGHMVVQDIPPSFLED